jgi:acyl-CoA reductase-like NAD-dependent aldehyde dehydrogenase
MSENNVGTVNPDSTDTDLASNLAAASTPAATLTTEQLAEFYALKAKADKAKQRADEAREERKRANGRPIDPETGKEMAAPLAFLRVQAQLLAKWTADYADNPTRLFERMNLQYIPMIVSLSNTPSSMLATAYDGKRRDMEAWMAIPDAPAPAPQQSNKK